MTSSTLFMAPAGHHHPSPPTSRNPSTSLSRSQSASDLPLWPSNDQQPAQRPPSRHQRALSDKSLPTLPSFDLPLGLEIPTFDPDFEVDTSVFFKKKNIDKAPASAPLPDAPGPPQRFSFARTRTGPVSERPRSWFPSSKSIKGFSLDSEPATTDTPRDDKGSKDRKTDLGRLPPLERSMTASDTFASFAKRPWMGSPRSPSHKIERPKTATMDKFSRDDEGDDGSPRKQTKPRKRPHFIDIPSLPRPTSDGGKVNTPKAIVKASTYLTKLKQKQASFTSSGTDSDASSANSFAGPPSTSTDPRTSQSTSESECTTTDESTGPKAEKDADPLWSSFKTLEVEFKGFTSRHMNQQIAQIQEVLMPFLCRTSPDGTVRGLPAEDVDRRASILNKWWVALLDMLDGTGQQPIPGVDRPFLLETTIMIMTRPEWRQTTPSFQPLAERSPSERVRARTYPASTGSTLSSSQADFLIESAEHNVRTMFVTNLVRQMGIVVDKLSLRHAPLSLVNFAGKTCAYAFFFAPGVAEVLIRLWGLMPDLIRRTGATFGLPRKSKGESDDIVALFPLHLSNLGWTSHRMLWDNLKRVPQMPLLVARIPWTGPWISRWKGRDTDLFYIFCKYFHVLADQFMPNELPLVEKARSPAFVLVQAQLLSVMDTTIHRQAALQQAQQPPLMDTATGADATAMAMPMPPTNIMKAMADNTLIVLLRNVLSDDSLDAAGAKHTFAEAFGMLMKAAAKQTSRYDNASCFSLCDFLEEIFRLYDEYDDMLYPSARVDWPFWIGVFKMILGSHNTMSEVRLLSFIFSSWDVIARRPQQKQALCLDWLLTRETFETFFNHWCPMVRAYYQRLLCWRICRDGGRANETDTNIFMVVASRLKTTWAHYLYIKHDAALAGRPSPSTAPTLPTPGKKFMIIRHEVNQPQPGLFMGFDSFAKLPNNTTTTLDAAESGNDDRPEGKKRWSLLGKMLGLGNGETEKEDADSKQERNLQDARQEVADSRGRSLVPPRPPPKPSSSSDSACSSPVFEEQKHIFRFILGWQQPAPPPRDRMLTKPRLPGPAQARVTVRNRDGSPPPPHASRPTATRTFSGNPAVGLVGGARNASPASDSQEGQSRRPSATFMRTISSDSGRASEASEDTAFIVFEDSKEHTPESTAIVNGLMEPMTKPVKPTGIYSKNAVYVGRALAEWSLVVFECNNFVDRRREEGVLGLSEVEVPVLGMEGFRKLGG